MSTHTGLYLFQWVWEAESMLPEDAYVNTFHFYNDIFPGSDYDNVRDMLLNFYNTEAPDAGSTIASWMTPVTLSGNYTLKAYNLHDTKPRAIKYQHTGTVDLGNQNAMPTECAAVFSFQAFPDSGQPQARRRNRVYLGPFGIGANQGDGYLSDNLVQAMLFAGKQLKKESDASAKWFWVIYSPTDDEFYAAENGWVDNAWDTQRRRGMPSTARGVFSDALPEA